MTTPSEIAVFSLSAQVYALDKTQKWTPLTQDVVVVSFLWDETTGTTRIFGKDERGVTVVNSTILANMAYRRPSETFVQWFDSQHILYGLNLTSVSDAEGFEREFDIATGKKPRPGSSQKKQANAGSPLVEKIEKEKPVVKPSVASNNNTPSKSATNEIKSSSSFEDANITAPPQMQMPQQRAMKSDSNASSSTGSDAKQITQLKARVKELELQNVSLEADRASLNETIASQSKTISGLQNQIKQLEADIDKLKSAFQQNATNVSMWKQQLQTYQEVNEQLSRKTTDLAELYEKFGEILKRD